MSTFRQFATITTPQGLARLGCPFLPGLRTAGAGRNDLVDGVGGHVRQRSELRPARIGSPAATAGVPTGLAAVGLRGAARRVGAAEPGGHQRIKTPGMA
jgi:hypothetical protein